MSISATNSENQETNQDFVQVTPQLLDSNKQAQARANIGALAKEDVSNLIQHVELNADKNLQLKFADGSVQVISLSELLLNRLQLKGVVDTYADLASIANPKPNDAYQVAADNLVYIYTMSGFQTEGKGFDISLDPSGKVEAGDFRAVNGNEVFEAVNNPAGKVLSGDNRPVSGGEVYDTSVLKKNVMDFNFYNSDKNIKGYYINTSGELQGHSTIDNYIVSEVIDVENIDVVYLHDWDRKSNFGVRYVSVTGTPMNALDKNGNPITFNSTYLGPFLKPEGAVGFQFTVMFNGLGNQDNLVVNSINSQKIRFKPELIDSSGKIKKGEMLPVNGDEIFKKAVLKNVLFIGGNYYNKSNDLVDKYIIESNGNLGNAVGYNASEVIDVTDIDKVIIQGRSGTKAYRFLNESGVQLKAKDKNGVDINYNQADNGVELYKPDGAVGFQFTTKTPTADSRDTIIVNSDGGASSETINPSLINKDLSVTVEKNADDIYISSKDGDNYFKTEIRTRSESLENNPNFNLIREYCNGKLIKTSSGDDIGPVSIQGIPTVGANHGFSRSRRVTLTGHGKTYSDIGAVYKDTQNNLFVIIKIINENEFVIVGKNISSTGFNYPNPFGELTYIENGSSTTNISGYTAVAYANLYTPIRLNSTKIYLDDKNITNLESYRGDGDSFKLVENYDILNFDDIIDNVIEGRPLTGYDSNIYLPEFGISSIVNVSNEYTWSANGKCLVKQTLFFPQDIEIANVFGIQMQSMNELARLYIPNSLPISGKDFRNAPTYDSTPLSFTPEYWEDENNPPSRVYSYTTDSGLHFGYLPELDIHSRVSSSIAIGISSARKIYPYFLYGSFSFSAGDTISFVGFRNIIAPVNSDKQRLYDYIINGDVGYLFVDFKEAGFDIVENIFSEKKNIEVVNSVNVNLKNQNNSPYLIMEVTDNYGFIILKFY